MRIVFEQDEIDAGMIEQAGGLPKGSVKAIIRYPEGYIELDMDKEPTETQRLAIRNILSQAGALRGRRPRIVRER